MTNSLPVRKRESRLVYHWGGRGYLLDRLDSNALELYLNPIERSLIRGIACAVSTPVRASAMNNPTV